MPLAAGKAYTTCIGMNFMHFRQKRDLLSNPQKGHIISSPALSLRQLARYGKKIQENGQRQLRYKTI